MRLTYFFVRRTPARAPASPAGVEIDEGREEDWRVFERPFPARLTCVVRIAGEPAHVSAAFETGGGIILGGSYTRPEFRGRGCYPLALRWLSSRLPGEVWINCDVRNEPSRRGILAAGFRLHRVQFSAPIGSWDPGRWVDAVLRRARALVPG